MEATKYLSCLIMACLAVLACYSSFTLACSCMPSHPQASYCNADYAVLVRVRGKNMRLVKNLAVYKVEIKKTYKVTAEGLRTLKHSRLLTPLEDSMCGVDLALGKLYVIAGRGTQLNSCNYIKEYQNMTMIERRGFSLAYRKACSCEVKPCFGGNCLKNVETASGCKWSPFATCETSFSICKPSSYQTPEGPIRQCRWKRTTQYNDCLLNA